MATQRISKQKYELEQFYKMPKWLFSDKFKNLSNDARIAYVLLKDRHSLSLKNNWVDENGDIFLIYTRKELAQILGVCLQKVTTIFKQLVKHKLIEDVRQGLNKANLIYLCEPLINPVSMRTFKKCVSGHAENAYQDIQKMRTNKTDSINTDIEEEEEERARENEVSDESFDDKKEEFDPQAFMVEFVKEKVKDEKQQNYLIELLSYKIIDLKTKTKSATATYVLKAIKQHGTEFSEKTEVQPRKKSKTAYKANKTRLETMPKWDNEPIQRTPEEEQAELARIKELMKDLK